MYESDVAIQLKETHHKISQVLQHKIDEYGISFGLLFLTMRIYNNPNANQKELAQQMKFTEGAMSNAVKRLIKLKMLKQVPLETDMRYNRLVITDLGISMIDDYKEYVVKKYKDMFEGLDEEELKKLQMSLIKINKNLDRMNTNIDSMGKTE
ncbi:MarR family winged helix-turn-helix transcriptional regulator [Paratissierella segnis]|jgi:DNA-binding MarR family transcriptional regulator|uniref:MarR family transcriptional regulator n=1 Tax=Paratissierella segnis TaxID=2763679 RepID=A0A926ESZ0_9FIRM|nr:MarR family transcriptional regulator [Paratissierella segnis]MBC8587091.1 MarR family transcriptional regulator [Paratissierella segnis]